MKAREELARLQALNLPHATPDVFGATIKEDAPDRAEAEKAIATLADYLKEFVPPSDCICCGKTLGAKSALEGLLGGATFVWGLAHGEGTCSNCGYPARAMHHIGDPEILFVPNFIMQYHPRTLEL